MMHAIGRLEQRETLDVWPGPRRLRAAAAGGGAGAATATSGAATSALPPPRYSVHQSMSDMPRPAADQARPYASGRILRKHVDGVRFRIVGPAGPVRYRRAVPARRACPACHRAC